MWRHCCKTLTVGVLLVTATACAEPAAEEVIIDGAWIRAVPPASKTMAGYMQVTNPSDQTLTLTGVRADFAGHSMIHAMETGEDGQRRMRHQDSLDVPAGESVALAPGGLHLMFMQVSQVPAPGEEVEVCLSWQQQEETCSSFQVRHNPPGQ